MERVRDRRDFVSRVALGIIAVTFLQWTNGGLYAVAFLPWLMMGWLDRDARDSAAPAVLGVEDELGSDRGGERPAELTLRS
jgi:hypothetical protein